MGRPRQVSDEEILEAARRCFHAHGPTVSTAVVAREVGVSAQALLKRFGSKEQLLLAALKPPERPAWIDELGSGPDTRSLDVQLRELFERLNAFFEAVTHDLAVLRFSPFDTKLMQSYDTPPPVHGMAALTAWLERAHEKRLIRRVDFRATALALIGSIQTRIILAHLLRRPVIEHTPAQYVDALVNLWSVALSPAVRIGDRS